MKLVFLFVYTIWPVMTSAAELTGQASNTVTNWYSMCREVCSSVIAKRQKIIGTSDDPIDDTDR